jgi:predicted MPP superfamily phosphohydrolase
LRRASVETQILSGAVGHVGGVAKQTNPRSEERPLNILTVSDVHGDVRRSLADDVASRELDVDLILLVGDLTNTPLFSHWPNTPERTRKRLKDLTFLLTVLSKIKPRHGIPYLFGNDDYRELAAEVVRDDIQSRKSGLGGGCPIVDPQQLKAGYDLAFGELSRRRLIPHKAIDIGAVCQCVTSRYT